MKSNSLSEAFSVIMFCYMIRRLIMSEDNELYAAGRLIQWALRPHARPTAESEYRELLDHYLDHLRFRDAVRAIAGGLGLHIVDAGLLGIVLAPIEDSIFAAKLSDYRSTGNAED